MVKSEAPLVTIAIASYNNGKYIEETLDSVNAQTYDNIELVIIDDCSTDNSRTIIEGWLKKCRYPYKFVKLETNGGITKMANQLLRHSSKDALYYSILGSDDTLLPDKIASQVSILNHTDEKVGLVYTDSFLIDSNSKRKFGTYMTITANCKYDYAPQGNILQELYKVNFLQTQSALYKKKVFDIVGGYDESLAFEDWDMSLRIAEKFEIIFQEKILVNYRVHSNSFSAKTKNWKVLLFPLYIKHAKSDLFRKRAKVALMEVYISRDPMIKEYIAMYETVLQKKHPYGWYMRNHLPVIVIRAMKKLYVDR